MEKKILITGASGFIGSFMVEEGLRQGMQVWAGVRHSSSRKYLQDTRIRFAELDFTDSDTLEKQLAEHRREHGGWDYIIHCAGVTKCLHRGDFEIANHWGTRHFIETLQRQGITPKRFVYLSSLSVFGPVHEKDYSDICDKDVPSPNTAYGISKLHAEEYLRSLPDFPYVILRPTGVYGPREHDYFLMMKSINRHLDMAAGFKRQDLTFVYVTDLVQAAYAALEKPTVRKSFFISDGNVYDSRTFSDLIRKELGSPWTIRFVCPLFLLRFISLIAENAARLSKKPGTLNSDKYRIMKQRNWRCDITPATKELEYSPRVTLEEGVKKTIAWYKKEGWL